MSGLVGDWTGRLSLTFDTYSRFGRVDRIVVDKLEKGRPNRILTESPFPLQVFVDDLGLPYPFRINPSFSRGSHTYESFRREGEERVSRSQPSIQSIPHP